MNSTSSESHGILRRADFQCLIDILKGRGYDVLGPTVKDAAIIYAAIGTVDDLPIGKTDIQDAGLYRLEDRRDKALFGYAVGPHSWKQFLYPSRLRLWTGRREGGVTTIEEEPMDTPRYAFLGMRACELKAVSVQDKVLIESAYTDPSYAERREQAFFIAVNCGEPSGTCFCVSMGSGPEAKSGYDLAMTEVLDEDGHRFLVRWGSEKGKDIFEGLPLHLAREGDIGAERDVLQRSEERMGRQLQTEGVQAGLQENPDHPRWDEVAARCLTCGNCTLVCPTCFCADVEDTTDLSGQSAEHTRRWDSCFSVDFTHMSGGSIRTSAKSRYRQWLTHKFSTWWDQFDTSGCVGCGRCITWCPVGIDVTEEVATIVGTEPADPGRE